MICLNVYSHLFHRHSLYIFTNIECLALVTPFRNYSLKAVMIKMPWKTGPYLPRNSSWSLGHLLDLYENLEEILSVLFLQGFCLLQICAYLDFIYSCHFSFSLMSFCQQGVRIPICYYFLWKHLHFNNSLFKCSRSMQDLMD